MDKLGVAQGFADLNKIFQNRVFEVTRTAQIVFAQHVYAVYCTNYCKRACLCYNGS
jgi:hypothetical protein